MENKNFLIKNIYFLSKINKISIGEIESQCDVSSGYISRYAKKSDSYPSMEFILKCSSIFRISVDLLINTDLSILDDEDKYIFDVIQMVKSKTEANEISWENLGYDYFYHLIKKDSELSNDYLFTELRNEPDSSFKVAFFYFKYFR